MHYMIATPAREGGQVVGTWRKHAVQLSCISLHHVLYLLILHL